MLAAPTAIAGDYHVPRNAYGQPDLEGVWTTSFIMPLEARPDAPALTLTEAEAAAYARKVATETRDSEVFRIDGEVAEGTERLAQHGLGVVKGQRRTRQVVLPADGIIPMTPKARATVQTIRDRMRNGPVPTGAADGPEQRPDWERCLVGQGQPPIIIVGDFNPRQILQTKDAVVVFTEYGSDVRIIPFSRTRGPATGSPMGDSIAWWEGDTLVIETTGMPARDTVRFFAVLLVPATAKVVERYTRVSDQELLYQYTVVDPSVYTGPWLAEYSLSQTTSPLYEFACHEGNYSLPNILSGERARERETSAAR